MLAHTGCWGGGFCLLCRQASMARWTQFYSRGSSADNLSQGEKKKTLKGELDTRSKLCTVRSGKPLGALSPKF